MRFGYEDFAVWDRAVDFAVRVIDVIESLESSRKRFRLLEQIEASVSSISMSLAEGKGRFSKKEFTHYCYIARGSLYETMTHLEIFKRKNWIANTKRDILNTQGGRRLNNGHCF